MASDALSVDRRSKRGIARAQGMTNNIELDSFSFGASNPADVGGKGLSAGKCSLSDFSFSCALDSSSYQILKTCTPARTSPRPLSTLANRQARRRLTPTSGRHDQLLHHQPQHRRRLTGIPSQSVSIAYEQIEFQYYTQDTTSGAVTGWCGDLQHWRRRNRHKRAGATLIRESGGISAAGKLAAEVPSARR